MSLMSIRLLRTSVVIMSFIFCMATHARSVTTQDLRKEIQGQVNAHLQSNNLTQGWDSKQNRLVVVEYASVGSTPGSQMYFISRQKAFDIALSSARESAARFLSAEINASIIAKKDLTQVIGNLELAKALTGVADNQAFKLEQELQKVSEIAAQVALVGFSAQQTFEIIVDDQAMVAVVGVYFTKYADLSHVNAHIDSEHTLKKWFEGLDDATLSRTYGTRYLIDEQGKFRLVAISQSAVQGSDALEDAACDVSRQDAQTQLVVADATSVACNSFSKALLQIKRIQDLPAELSDVKQLKDHITASAQDQISAVLVGTRIINDPNAGRICIAAYVLDKSIADLNTINSPPQVGCPAVPDNMVKFIRSVQVAGVGRNESEAIERALFEAIRQEGAMIEVGSVLQKKYKEATKSVNQDVQKMAEASVNQSMRGGSFANGFVHSYAVLESKPGVNDSVDVRICANMVRFDPNNPRFGLSPTIVVLPAIVAVGAVKVAGQPQNPNEYAQLVERALEQTLLTSNKYQVLDEANNSQLSDMRNKLKERAQQGRLDEMELIKLGHELSADFALLVQIDHIEFTGESGPQPENVQSKDVARANIQCRLVNVVTNETAWQQTANVKLVGREIVMVRAGKDMKDPAEISMAPAELACSRACALLVVGLKNVLGTTLAQKQAEEKPIRMIRISGQEITLDAEHPKIKIGARFKIETPVSIEVGGKLMVDRDKVAVIEVILIKDGIAKAKVIEGDIDLIQIGISEAVPAE